MVNYTLRGGVLETWGEVSGSVRKFVRQERHGMAKTLQNEIR